MRVESPPPRGDDAVIARALHRFFAVVAVAVVVVAAVILLRGRTSRDSVIEKNVRLPEVLDTGDIELPSIPFSDVTATAGIVFVHHSGARGDKLLPETMGSGVAVFDVDSDGDQDLLFVNSTDWPWTKNPVAGSMALYTNDGRGVFTDETRAWGLGAPIYGMGVAVGDVEGDGDPDLFLTAVGANRLMINEGTLFRDGTRVAGLAGDSRAWSTCAGFFDADGDGDLDLLVANYVQWSREVDFEVGFTLNGTDRAYGPPTSFAGTVPWLYLNDGAGRFREVGEEAGLRVMNPATGEPIAKALGLAIDDFDGDGRLDVLLANDTVRNFVYRNLGGARFEEIGVAAGVGFDPSGTATGAMGIDVADYRNDGRLGIAIGNFANEMSSLYVAQGPLVFADEAVIEGIGSASRLRLSFGMLFLDADLDGRQDLLTVNGHIDDAISEVQASQRHRQSAQLFWNTGRNDAATFLPLPEGSVADLARPVVGRGAAAADLDADGDLDVVMTTNGGSPILLRNDQSLGHHWLRVVLRDVGANPAAVGALVELEADGITQRRRVMPTRSYLSQVEIPVTFGLGRRSDEVTVRVTWPDGFMQEFGDVAVDRILEVRRRSD